MDLGAPFWDPRAPFGHPWDPFWCLFKTLGRDPGPLFRLFWKMFEKGTKKDRKRELEWIYVLWNFEFSQKVTNSVWIAQARADWGSGHSFSVFLPPLLLLLFAIVFACFLAPPGSPDS